MKNKKRKINENELITKKQAVAYGIVAYYTLLHSANNKTTCAFFGKEIITIMELNPPQEVVLRADRILKRE